MDGGLRAEFIDRINAMAVDPMMRMRRPLASEEPHGSWIYEYESAVVECVRVLVDPDAEAKSITMVGVKFLSDDQGELSD